jgi:hypothetical protein
MYKFYFTITISLLCLFSNAQKKSTGSTELTLKVKPIKSISCELCNKEDHLKDAIVVEFEVVDAIDKKRFGNKIYAIERCEDYTSAASKYSNIWNLTISKIQPTRDKPIILNEELLNQNRHKEKYWIVDFYREVVTY